MNSTAAAVGINAWPAAADASSARFWLVHAWLPAIACASMLALFSLSSLDTLIASRLFFDFAQRHWFGAGAWWANDLIHTGGRGLVTVVDATALALWVLGRFRPGLRAPGAIAGYVALAMVLAVGLAGLLKRLTNVDCPWDLSLFDGARPYVHVFGDRPDTLPRGHCFPGAHSSSGFALLCLYFAFRDRRPRAALAGLCAGIALGALFSFGQEARGAHFLSHDLTSAFLAWFVSLGVYAAWKGRSQ